MRDSYAQCVRLGMSAAVCLAINCSDFALAHCTRFNCLGFSMENRLLMKKWITI